MFSKLENIDPENHKRLRLRPAKDFHFAASLTSAPLSATEVTAAARHYPVVFPAEGKVLPIALLSLKEGENAYVDSAGKWRVPYVPAHVRRYPFILADTDDPDKFIVALDRDAPHFRTGKGDPLYGKNGEMTPALTQAIEFLKQFQGEAVATEKLVQPLVEMDVLTMQRIDITKADGGKSSFDGVRAVDMERLNKLDDATLAEWVRNGLMGLIHAHLASLGNFNMLAEWQESAGPLQ